MSILNNLRRKTGELRDGDEEGEVILKIYLIQIAVESTMKIPMTTSETVKGPRSMILKMENQDQRGILTDGHTCSLILNIR